MGALRIFLFGAPRIEHEGRSLPLRRSKGLALLAYLALTRQPQEREALLGLLWPEFSPESARNNLRRELSLLKTALGDTLLLVDRLQVAWNPQAVAWLDVAAFQAQIAAAQARWPAGRDQDERAAALTEAAALYSEDFLAGFDLPDCPAFEEWQFFVREELRQQLAQALQLLIEWRASRGEYEAGLVHARRWLALDPLHEPAQRELMRLYAWAGQQAAALRQYEECARLLDQELGIAPEAATTALYEQIRARAVARPLPAPAVPPAAEPPAAAAAPANAAPLPKSGGFVGRERELADIVRRLTDPACRMLTLVGPGGIGKTRLALQVGHTLAQGWAGEDELADGVVFVALAAVTTPEALLAAIATTVGFGFVANVEPRRQVLDALRDRSLLLILDNFEQLLDAAEFIDELLATAPRLRLLVTSREALNLADEWFHPIDGLSFPVGDDADLGVAQLARYDSIRLFEQHARRVRGDFSLSRSRDAVVRLCRLVEGMPLAIELAAAWLKVLPMEQLVDALERGLDILSSRNTTLPERHRSMRAAFEQSWLLLSALERDVFRRLSIFRGGFSQEAASAVLSPEPASRARERLRGPGPSVQASALHLLASLVDKSLLRCDPDGRYQMHELLRQFGAEQLASDEAALDATRQAHSDYYIELLAARRAASSGEGQAAAVAEILVEQENIGSAWQWASARCDLDAIDRAGHTLAVFYEFRGRYQEGVAALELGIAGLRGLAPGRQRDGVYAARLVDLGWLHIRLGDLACARAALEESRALFDALETVPLPSQASDPLLGLGMVALLEGRYAEATLLGEVALERSELPERATNRPRALFLLLKAAHAQGRYEAAQGYAQEALVAAEQHGHRWLVASLYNELATTQCAMGNYAEASHHYEVYYRLREAFDDRRGMATGLLGLGRVAHRDGRSAEARELLERSLAMLRQVGAQVDIGWALDELAGLALAGDAQDRARAYLAEAFQVAQQSASQPLLLSVLIGIAQLLLPTAHAAWGPEALTLVREHPASDYATAERAERLLAAYRRALDPAQFEAAVRRGQRSSLGLLSPQIKAILALPAVS